MLILAILIQEVLFVRTTQLSAPDMELCIKLGVRGISLYFVLQIRPVGKSKRGRLWEIMIGQNLQIRIYLFQRGHLSLDHGEPFTLPNEYRGSEGRSQREVCKSILPRNFPLSEDRVAAVNSRILGTSRHNVSSSCLRTSMNASYLVRIAQRHPAAAFDPSS